MSLLLCVCPGVTDPGHVCASVRGAHGHPRGKGQEDWEGEVCRRWLHYHRGGLHLCQWQSHPGTLIGCRYIWILYHKILDWDSSCLMGVGVSKMYEGPIKLLEPWSISANIHHIHSDINWIKAHLNYLKVCSLVKFSASFIMDRTGQNVCHSEPVVNGPHIPFSMDDGDKFVLRTIRPIRWFQISLFS